MKLRGRLTLHQLLFATTLAVNLIAGAGAQDQLVQTDGRTQQGKIVGVTGNAIQLQVGQGTIGVPIASVARVVMAAPPQVADAQSAFAAKDYAKAAGAAKAVADKFKGLPADWAEQMALMLGDCYVELNEFDKADAAFGDFEKFYGAKAQGQTDVGKARVLFSKKDYDGAKRKLDPLAEAALKLKVPDPAQGRLYGRVFLLLGQIAEAKGDAQVALEDYLYAATLFHHDKAVAAQAEEKANALRKANKVVIP